MSIKNLQQDWQELGELDPCYAVLSHADKKFGKWDETAFFATGEDEVARLMERVASFSLPLARAHALDFGCGLGRLTRALASRFAEVTGVDIAVSMIDGAKKVNAAFPACHFIVNTTPDLALFAENTFDLVYSSIVLQHVSDPEARKAYIREFVRVLKPGGIVAFQLPSRIPWKFRLQPTRRVYHFLHALGVSADTLYKKLNLVPIAMNFLTEEGVRHEVEAAHGKVLSSERDTFSGPSVESRTYFVGK
jgi:ubiquinone/menaquinone biosynthesis C-methylase UbiE